MSPRPDATAIRIPQIIEAAITVFAKHGFAKARMEDVAEEAGLSKALLYRYFKNKDALIEAIMEEMLNRELEDILALLENNDPVPDRLLELNQIFVRDWQKLKSFLPLLLEFYANAHRHAAVSEAFKQSYAEIRALLAKLFREGVERGELRLDDPEEAAITLLAIYEGLMTLCVIDPDMVQWERQSESAIRMLIQGMRA